MSLLFNVLLHDSFFREANPVVDLYALYTFHFSGKYSISLPCFRTCLFGNTNQNKPNKKPNNRQTSGEDDAGAKAGDSSAILETAAPDILNEEAFFTPRSRAQENANAGIVDEKTGDGPPSAPTGPWVEAAKELVPPPPPPEVK